MGTKTVEEVGKVRGLAIDNLRTDGGCQMRTRIDHDHVERLAEAFGRDPGSVPPISVLCDSKHFWVWDGNHRILGAQQAGLETIMCRVEKGTQRDAMLLAAGANAKHGLPRTAADKRLAVKTLLQDKTWGKRSDRWIADACGVSHPTVADVRRDLRGRSEPSEEGGQVVNLPPGEIEIVGGKTIVGGKSLDAKPAPREGRDGKTYASPAASKADSQVATSPPETGVSGVDPSELLPKDLAKTIRNTAAAADSRQVAKLARLAAKDPALAETVANMLRDCEVQTVEEALEESDTVDDPQEEASDVLRQMLSKAKSAWRISCPQKASPALGASVLEQVADEWLNGGWFV